MIARRRFLSWMGAVAAPSQLDVLSACAGSGSATQPPWRLRLSTSSIHFMELPVEQACRRIAGLGFEAIDVWSAHEGCPHLDDVASRLGPDGLQEVLETHGLKLFAFSVYAGGYARYAELLGKLGGGVAVQGSAPPCEPDELRTRMGRFFEQLKPLADLAERHDSYLAIENHGHALLDSLDSLKAFVDMNPSPRLGIALAPYHLQAIGASVPQAIRICGHQLLFFYAWQNQPGARQLPGIGPADMLPWIQALAEIRYRGYVNAFMHGHPGPDVMTDNLRASHAYLLRCGRQMRATSDT
jgi:sugar phosphate isomerase/epimerase